jgi:hypothetical protein
MLDETEFRSLSEIALESLKQHLFVLEESEDAGFEIFCGAARYVAFS